MPSFSDMTLKELEDLYSETAKNILSEDGCFKLIEARLKELKSILEEIEKRKGKK